MQKKQKEPDWAGLGEEAILRFLRPTGYEVRWLPYEDRLEASASGWGVRHPVLHAALPRDEQTLFILLHEIGHVAARHSHDPVDDFRDLFVLPDAPAIKEEQASCWARDWLLSRGVQISAKMWAEAQSECGNCTFTCEPGDTLHAPPHTD